MNVCWLITGQSDVLISFSYFWTKPDHDFVRIYDGDSISSPCLLQVNGGVYQGNYRYSAVSSTNQMLVIFNPDSSNFKLDSSVSYIGFNASYSSCSVLASNSENISSPNYPNNYDNLDSVCWLISQPIGYTVSLKFNDFNTEDNDDVVRVFDGNSTNSALLLSASGSTAPSAVNSSSNEMLIVFTSDNSNVRTGFQATFHAVHSVDVA